MSAKLVNYIEKIKTKSERERKKVLMFWTVIIVAIIFVLWLTNLNVIFSNQAVEQATAQAEAERLAKQAVIKAESAPAENSKNVSVDSVEPKSGSGSEVLTVFRQNLTEAGKSIKEGFLVIFNRGSQSKTDNF